MTDRKLATTLCLWHSRPVNIVFPHAGPDSDTHLPCAVLAVALPAADNCMQNTVSVCKQPCGKAITDSQKNQWHEIAPTHRKLETTGWLEMLGGDKNDDDVNIDSYSNCSMYISHLFLQDQVLNLQSYSSEKHHCIENDCDISRLYSLKTLPGTLHSNLAKNVEWTQSTLDIWWDRNCFLYFFSRNINLEPF